MLLSLHFRSMDSGSTNGIQVQKKLLAGFKQTLLGALEILGAMELEMTFQKQSGISSSQLTNNHIFQRGRYTTNHIYIYNITMQNHHAM